MKLELDSNIKYVSFDVFDTLVRRILSEDEMLKCIEQKMLRDGKIYAKNFVKNRLAAKNYLISINKTNYTLTDIYNTRFFSNLDNNEKTDVMNEEIQAELSNCIVNDSGFEIYNKFKDKKKIICISDMYHSTNTVSDILVKNGYCISKVFVSSDCGLTKRSRALFKYVLNDLNIKKNEIIHIGDSLRSDFINPRFLGIYSYHLKRGNFNHNFYYNLGENVFGPLMYEFSRWLKNKSKDGTLIFLAREGECFSHFYGLIFRTQCKVAYVSRKSLLKANAYLYLKKSKIEDIINLSSLSYRESVYDFCLRIGLDYGKYETLFQKANIMKNSLIDSKFISFINNNSCIFLEEAKKNYDFFDEYISKYITNDKVNYLVDIGWKGSIQEMMSSFLKSKSQNLEIKGLYLGVTNTNKKDGFLFSSKSNVFKDVLLFSGLLEILFMPEYGSVLGYKKQKNIVTPVFDKFEFSEENYKIIRTVQKGIENVLSRLSFYNQIELFKRQTIINKLVKFGNMPDRFSISCFKKLDLYDNQKLYKLVPDYSIMQYLNLRKIYIDFRNSKWKSAFLINLTKIRFPYYLFLRLFKR